MAERTVPLHQIAQAFGVSERTVGRWVKKRRCPHTRRGARKLFDREEVRAWLKEQNLTCQQGVRPDTVRSAGGYAPPAGPGSDPSSPRRPGDKPAPGGVTKEDLDYAAWRGATARAYGHELKNRQLEGELMEVAKVRAAWSAAGIDVRTGLYELVEKVASEGAGLTSDELRVLVTAEVDRTLRALSARFMSA